MTINVLIACEESQEECKAFRARGFNAFSCDVQPCRKRGGHPEWHICGDVTPFLNGSTEFQTMDGQHHHLSRWHLVVAHPPCTYLCKVSSVWMVKAGVVQLPRLRKMQEAVRFFHQCYAARAPFVAVENPLPMARAGLPPPDCYIQPSWYGEKYTKKTLYWLRNLPPLMPELIYPDAKSFVRASRGKYRSRTFPGVARAIARQWGDYVKKELKNRV